MAGQGGVSGHRSYVAPAVSDWGATDYDRTCHGCGYRCPRPAAGGYAASPAGIRWHGSGKSRNRPARALYPHEYRAGHLCDHRRQAGLSDRDGDRYGGGRGHRRHDDHPHGDQAARPGADGQTARRRALRDRAEDRRLDLHDHAPGDRDSAGRRRERAAQSGAPAGTRHEPGLVRPDPRSQRARQSAIPHRRRHLAGRHQRFWAKPQPALRHSGRAHHRCVAGAIRSADCGHHRHPDQERGLRPGWLRRHLSGASTTM